MKIAPKPPREEARIALLRDLDLLNQEHLDALEELVQLASHICQTPMCAVSLVYEDKQFFKASCGLGTQETGRDEAFCAHAILADQTLIVEDAKADVRFHDNPLVDGSPFIRFYAGVPLITRDKLALGTLCVLDAKPRKLEAAQQKALETLARQVTFCLELRSLQKQLQQTMSSLQAENCSRLILSQKMTAVSALVHDLHHELRNFQLTTQPQVDLEKKKFAVLFATHDLVEVWNSLEAELFKIRRDNPKAIEDSNVVLSRKDLNSQQKNFMLSMLGPGLSLERAQELLTAFLQLDPGYQASIQALFGVLDSFLLMADGARRLNQMTGSLLDQIASEASEDQFELSPAITSTLSLFAKRSRSSGISISTQQDANLIAQGTRADFQHILLNLLRLCFDIAANSPEEGATRNIKVYVAKLEHSVACQVICTHMAAQEPALREALSKDIHSLETDRVELGWHVAEQLAQKNQWTLSIHSLNKDLVFECSIPKN